MCVWHSWFSCVCVCLLYLDAVHEESTWLSAFDADVSVEQICGGVDHKYSITGIGCYWESKIFVRDSVSARHSDDDFVRSLAFWSMVHVVHDDSNDPRHYLVS